MPSETPKRPHVTKQPKRLPSRYQPSKRDGTARASSRDGRRAAPMVITIDGPAGSGKSTVAKLLADELGLTYLDTGATYRALAWAVLQQPRPDFSNVIALATMAQMLPLKVQPGPGGTLRVFLDGTEITQSIRTQEVSEAAAHISQYPEVREAMVSRQRELAKAHGVVVEGRDTGSVVFPDAPHKFFLDADLTIRAERRQQELAKLYDDPTPLPQIREELHYRDNLDRNRQVGPLIKPQGAVAIDTTSLTASQVARRILQHVTGAT